MKEIGIPSLLIRLLVWIMVLSFVFCSSVAENASWDCPECGRIGNKGNFCGGCGQAAPWMESGEPKTDSYGPYRNVIDKIEKTVAEKALGPDEIIRTLADYYGLFTEEDLAMYLEPQTHHRVDYGDVEMSYFNGEWFYSYSVRYYNKSKTGYLFEQEYIRVADLSYCDTNQPTYSNWFAAEAVLVPLTASSGNEYHLYTGDTDLNQINVYVNTEYYDPMTVLEYAVWNGWDFFIGVQN